VSILVVVKTNFQFCAILFGAENVPGIFHLNTSADFKRYAPELLSV
jgi:hypothetical protein